MRVTICGYCEMPITGKLPSNMEHTSLCTRPKSGLKEIASIGLVDEKKPETIVVYYVKVLRVQRGNVYAYMLGGTEWSVMVNANELPEKISELHAQGYAVVASLSSNRYESAIDHANIKKYVKR